MKKITFMLFALVAFCWQSNAQTLDQNAAWPNAAWTVTGVYTATGFQFDPTTTTNFMFDDDDAGNGSDDNIAAESPIIDLTAASTAGETWLTVSGDYVYRYLASDELKFQYWDADATIWVDWGFGFAADTAGAPTSLYCGATPETYTSSILNIVAFTSTQLSGFKYRISYDDNPAGADWNYGFCFQSPTITSETPPSCPVPMGLASSAIGLDTASFSWTTGGSETAWEYVNLLASDPAPTAGTATSTMTYMATGLTASTDYIFYVRSDCGGSFSDFASIAYSTSSLGEVCETAIDASAIPYSTTDDTANYGDDYTGVPGTTCGATSSYLNGDDVVYSYTATADTQISIDLTPTATYSGIFVYADCADIGTACIAGIGNSGTGIREIDLDVLTGETYYIVISTWAAPQTTAYTLDIYENTCESATVAYTVVNDCEVSGGFLLDVEITDMGTATEILVSNDQDATSFTVTSAMTVQFGPYTNGIPVVVTLDDQGDDDTCTVISSAQTQAACPPANDECADAIELTVNADLSCTATTPGTIASATASGEDEASCFGTENDDVWFTFVAAAESHTIGLINITGGTTDLYHSVWSGECGTLTNLSCSDPNTSTIEGLTIGETYTLRVYSWTSTAGQTSSFDVCIGTLPGPPVNDDCANATALTVNADLSCTTTTPGTIASATASGDDEASCGGTEDDDVWFTFVAAAASHTIDLINITGSTTDLYHSVWSGECGTLTNLSCSDPNSSTIEGLTIGETYTLRVYSWTSTAGQTSSFDVCIGTPCQADAGTLTADAASVVLSGPTTISATEDTAPTIPANYDVTYVLTSGPTLIIEQASATPSFVVNAIGDYTIHTLVAETTDAADPNYLDLSVIEYGTTTGGDVLDIIAAGDLCAALDVTGAPISVNDGSEMDFNNVQWVTDGTNGSDSSLTVEVTTDVTIYAQGYEAGVTDAAGAGAGVECWIAINNENTDPSTWDDSLWEVATYGSDQGNNDEYVYNSSTTAPGTNYVAARWRLNNASFTYGGYNGTWDGTTNVNIELIVNPLANDDCAGAIALTPGAVYADNPVDGTVLGATADAEAAACGSTGPGVWYSVVVPADGNITIEIGDDSLGGTGFDSVIEAFSGTCGALTSIDCDDDGVPGFGDAYSQLVLTGLTGGETIYVRVWEYGGNDVEPFSISAYSATLSVGNFENESAFTYYPNPVKNTLTLSAQNTIEQVSMYNMLGQEVLRVTPNTLASDLDMSNLQIGTYFVKVTIANVTETIRVIKQ